jgi:hypothetical protein
MSRHTVTGRDEANNLGPISPSNTSSNRNTIGSRMSPALPQGWRRSSTEEMTKNNVLMTMLPSSNVMSSMRGFLRSTSAAFRSLERARSRRCAAFMPKRAVSEPLKKALPARSIGSDSARPASRAVHVSWLAEAITVESQEGLPELGGAPLSEMLVRISVSATRFFIR